MKIVIVGLFVFTLSGCTHSNDQAKAESKPSNALGVVFLDYYDQHLELSVNGSKIFDRVVYADRGGNGISASFAINTPENFLIEFCVDGYCGQRRFSRTKEDIYLLIAQRGPIATSPPYMELTSELDGLD